MTGATTGRTAEQAFEDLYRASNLTRRQLRAWLGHRARPAATLWNLAVRMPIAGDLEPERWEAAFAAVVAASDALRSRFDEVDGAPRRLVEPLGPIRVARVDLSDAPDPTRAAREWMDRRCALPRPLAGPLYEAALLRLGPARWEWFLLQDHLITDGVALEIIARTVAELYAGPAPTDRLVPPALPSFADFAAAERAASELPRFGEDRAFWEEVLASERSPASWNGRRKDPARLEIVRLSHTLDAARTDALRARTAAPGAPRLPSLLLAAFADWVAQSAGTPDPVLTTAVHNRRRAQHKRTIGLLMDVIPLRRAEPAGAAADPLLQARQWERRLHSSLRRDPAALPALSFDQQAFLFNYHREQFRFEGGGIRAEQHWLAPRQAIELVALQVSDHAAAGRLQLDFDLDAAAFAGREVGTVASFLAALDGHLDGGATAGLARALRGIAEVREYRLENDPGAEGGPALRLEAAVRGGLTPLGLRRRLLAAVSPRELPDSITIVDSCGPCARAPDADAAAADAVPSHSARAPQGPAEQLIAAVWCEVLGLPAVSAGDRFLARGGDSLRAVLATTLIESGSGVRLRPEEMFLRDLAQLARLLESRSGRTGSA